MLITAKLQNILVDQFRQLIFNLGRKEEEDIGVNLNRSSLAQTSHAAIFFMTFNCRAYLVFTPEQVWCMQGLPAA